VLSSYKVAMLDDASKLPDDPADLKDLVIRLASELKNRDLKIAKLKHELAGHRRHRFGSRSEAMDQLELQLEEEEIAAAKAEPPSSPDEPAEPKGNASRCPPICRATNRCCHPAMRAASAAAGSRRSVRTSPRSWSMSPVGSS